MSCSRGSGRQRFALVNIRARLRARETELKQLANYSEREVRLKLRPASTQDLLAEFSSTLAGRLEQRRFANPCHDEAILAGPNRESGDSQQRDVRFQHSEILTMHRLLTSTGRIRQSAPISDKDGGLFQKNSAERAALQPTIHS